MNDEERGRSPCENHAAVAGPLDVTRGRERRRFLSSAAWATRVTAAAGPAATFAAVLAADFAFPSAAFSAFAAAFVVTFAVAGFRAALGEAAFLGAAFFGAAFFGVVFFGAAFFGAFFFGAGFFAAIFFAAGFFAAAFFAAGFGAFFGAAALAGFFFTAAFAFAAGFFGAGFLPVFARATAFAAPFFFRLVAAFLPCTFAIRPCSPGSPEKWMAQYSGDPPLCIAVLLCRFAALSVAGCRLPGYWLFISVTAARPRRTDHSASAGRHRRRRCRRV